MPKTALRSHYLQKRKDLPPDKRQEFSRQICRALLALPALRLRQRVAAYEAFPSEVDVAEFVTQKKKSGVHVHILDKTTTHVGEDIQAWIVPGIVFDKFGHRIGFGKGTYDRLLEKSSGLKIGVAFSCQIHAEPLPAQSHDVRLDFLVTENHVYSFL